jgi:hypothetical protein
VPPKLRLTSYRLHGVTSQKTELFITTATRTSNPTAHTFTVNWNLLLNAPKYSTYKLTTAVTDDIHIWEVFVRYVLGAGIYQEESLSLKF